MLNFYLGQLVLDQFLLFEVGSDGSDIMEVTSFCSRFFHFLPPFDDPSETVPLSFPLFFQNFSKQKLQLVGDFDKYDNGVIRQMFRDLKANVKKFKHGFTAKLNTTQQAKRKILLRRLLLTS